MGDGLQISPIPLQGPTRGWGRADTPPYAAGAGWSTCPCAAAAGEGLGGNRCWCRGANGTVGMQQRAARDRIAGCSPPRRRRRRRAKGVVCLFLAGSGRGGCSAAPHNQARPQQRASNHARSQRRSSTVLPSVPAAAHSGHILLWSFRTIAPTSALPPTHYTLHPTEPASHLVRIILVEANLVRLIVRRLHHSLRKRSMFKGTSLQQSSNNGNAAMHLQ